jgi:uracil-DNA glycosylase family 4
MHSNEAVLALKDTLEFLYKDLLDTPLIPLPEQSAPAESASEGLAALAEEMRFCEKCVLHIGRKNLVFGRGHTGAQIAFVGDFPSLADDEAASPFTDEAGALLQKMIVAMRLNPEGTYQTNLYKCKPPVHQRFDQDLAVACEKHLQRQFRFLPAANVIVALGEECGRALARSSAPLNVLRKQEFEWNGRRVFCTHHPRDLLSSPQKKKEAWEDLRLVMREMGIQP